MEWKPRLRNDSSEFLVFVFVVTTCIVNLAVLSLSWPCFATHAELCTASEDMMHTVCEDNIPAHSPPLQTVTSDFLFTADLTSLDCFFRLLCPFFILNM